MAVSTEMRICQFHSTDLVSVKILIHSTIDACYTNVYPKRAVQYFKEFHSDEQILKDASDGYTIILVQEAHIIGTGTIVRNHIYRVFIDPRFQRQGFGRVVMKHLEEKAKSSGLSEVVLDISLPSRQFYNRLGYEIIEEAQLDVGDSQYLDYWKARKVL